jgi:hypothetical protein
MPLPIPGPGTPATSTYAKQFYVRDRQDWAIEQERYRHDQALYSIGEYSIFYLMWSLLDLEAGLVTRCARCYGTAGTIANRETVVYNQPTINRCPDCFGTTYEGGFRARIVRPAIWADNDESEKQDAKGVVHPETVNVESTWDFRMRQGDYIIRADGSRWRLPASPRRTTLRSGYDHPGQAANAISYSQIQARLEEAGTVAYTLLPTDKISIHTLLVQPGYFPRDFATFQIVRAPLIPSDGVID